MQFKADRSKICYRHCDSGDLLQMATVESRGTKGAEVRDKRSQTGREHWCHLGTLYQHKDILQVLEGLNRIEKNL